MNGRLVCLLFGLTPKPVPWLSGTHTEQTRDWHRLQPVRARNGLDGRQSSLGSRIVAKDWLALGLSICDSSSSLSLSPTNFALCALCAAHVFWCFSAGLPIVQSNPQVYADYYRKSKLRSVAMKQVCVCARAWLNVLFFFQLFKMF